MAPVYRAIAKRNQLRPILVSTGQQRSLLVDTLNSFELTPDLDLAVMTADQELGVTTAKILEGCTKAFADIRPDIVLTQGDTTTAFAAGLAAFYQRVPVGHVEAGLRTYNWDNPFPEEANRQLVDRLSTWCFAPTQTCVEHLLSERIEAERILVTGNTGIDALRWILERQPLPENQDPFVLLTLHRRESFGQWLAQILDGVTDFLDAIPEARIIWPVHPNPNVQLMAKQRFGKRRQVNLVPPADYPTFARLMADCRFILTDSGGVQEEAPSLGKRSLVARDETERPEGIASGHNQLVGRNRADVARALIESWREPPILDPANPFGDGQAADRIAAALVR